MLTTGEIRKILQSKDPVKIAMIPKEDLKIFLENEEHREAWTAKGMKEVYAGICELAVKDYKTAHKMAMFYRDQNMPYSKSRIEISLEQFFGSDFFLMVTGLRSKEHVIQEIERTMIEEKNRKMETRSAMA